MRPDGTSINGLDGNAEHVSRAAFGPDVLRLRGTGLELAPQAHDLLVDGSVVDIVAVQPRHVDELVARQNAMRRTKENDEQTELAVRELDQTAVGRLEPTGVEIELPSIETIG